MGTHRHCVGPIHLFIVISFQAFHHVSGLSGLLHVSGISSDSFGIVLCHVSKQLPLCSVHGRNYITDFLKIRFRYESDTPSRYERYHEWKHSNVSSPFISRQPFWKHFNFNCVTCKICRDAVTNLPCTNTLNILWKHAHMSRSCYVMLASYIRNKDFRTSTSELNYTLIHIVKFSEFRVPNSKIMSRSNPTQNPKPKFSQCMIYTHLEREVCNRTV